MFKTESLGNFYYTSKNIAMQISTGNAMFVEQAVWQ
jgi:hypothetical protein